MCLFNSFIQLEQLNDAFLTIRPVFSAFKTAHSCRQVHLMKIVFYFSVGNKTA